MFRDDSATPHWAAVYGDAEALIAIRHGISLKIALSYKELDQDSRTRISIMNLSLRISIGDTPENLPKETGEFLPYVESVRNYFNIDGSPLKLNVFNFIYSAKNDRLDTCSTEDFFSQLSEVMMKDRQYICALQSITLQNAGQSGDVRGL